ncbi:MAG TPA: class I SAM-dependent methyltransferase [Kofleriaceae bacterium]|jgi:2-polyprenyl-3-methyl-5-hydroxy-6-metoxy-1,4-benzoquinol methylase
MIYVLILLATVVLLDGFRMRRRIGQLAILEPTDEPPTHRAIGELSESTLRAASKYMREHRIELLDIVPRDLPALRVLSLVQLVDPTVYRADRVGVGHTACHAIVISNELAERARVDETPKDEIELTHLAARLKHYGNADLAIAPDEHARPSDLSRRRELLWAVLGPSAPLALGTLVVMWALIGFGIWLHPLFGLIAAGAWLVQPIIALVGTRLGTFDAIVFAVFRAPIEAYVLLRTLFARRISDTAAATKKPVYDELLAGDRARFYNPRRDTCPLCGSTQLGKHMTNPDLFQHKPGKFTLDRCRACQHVFQNPQLSIAGLDFYYKDFYDGLGESGMEFIFGFGVQPYLDRARMVRAVAEPKRWLDVGAGHGHFCVAARSELPGTRFDGLDLSESIDEAKRRGWVETSYRGLFPDVAPELAGQYDAVSMSHYLEHTLDPKKEIEAAHTALATNGTLMIEVPDPEFILGKVLGKYWLPWFQPQHLHFVSVANLDKLLRERGFEPLEWHRGKAHQRVDFLFAVWLFLDRIAPPRKLPWRWRGALSGVWRTAVWAVGAPFIIVGIAVDNLIGPLWARGRISNTYRVVARKTG